MLKYCRIFVLLVLGILGFFLALLICLPRPFNPRNTSLVTRYILAPAARIVGLKIHMEEPEFLAGMKSAVYAGNHQSNWDIVALAPCVRPGVIAIGKKSLVWVPLFGLIYFLAGNVRLDRENKQKAMETMNKVSQDLGSGKYSIWIFPEGTRSKGTGLGKFKPGAIVTASEAGVPLVPIVASTYFDDFDMNRWNNGHVLIKYLDPIEYPKFDMKNKEDLRRVRTCTQELHDLFAREIESLNAKALEMNQADGVKPGKKKAQTSGGAAGAGDSTASGGKDGEPGAGA